MRGDEKIDFLQAGRLGRKAMNAFGIAPARVARINEHGLPRRSDDECRTAAFGINPVDIERFVGFAGLRGQEGTACNQGG